MRITAVSAAGALLLLSVSTSLMAQRPDDQIDPRSLSLLQEGRSAAAAGALDRAEDLIETALAVDPRNRQAFVALAEISQRRELPGKAIRFYAEALALEPNDAEALRGQGEAMVAKGAVEKAKANLERLRKLCNGDCADATRLAAAIEKGPPATATAQQMPIPSAGPTPAPTDKP